MLLVGLEDPVFLLYLLIGFLLGFTIHESSHALMAYALGDPTAKDKGRLSLNPLVHLASFGDAVNSPVWVWVGASQCP